MFIIFVLDLVLTSETCHGKFVGCIILKSLVYFMYLYQTYYICYVLIPTPLLSLAEPDVLV